MKGFDETGRFGSDIGLSEDAVVAELYVCGIDLGTLGLLERLLGSLGYFEKKLFEELIDLLEGILTDLSSASVFLENVFDVAVTGEFARGHGE